MKHNIKPIGLILLSAFALSACADDGAVYKDKTNNGIAIGALVGAAAGAILGDDGKDVVIGTAAGGIIGGLIGNSLQKQEDALRGSLSKNGATVQNTGSELIVTLQDDVTFDTNSTHVRNSFRPEINKIAANLRDFPDTTVDVIGHTDSSGSDTYNQALSADRAYAVSSILTNKGVPSSRIASYGRGETDPKATNDSEYGKAINRRVEIVIRPEA